MVTRVKLKETQDAAYEEWGRINDELAESVENLRSQRITPPKLNNVAAQM